MYTCDSYYQKTKVDKTVSKDSLSSTSEDIMLDEDGNPVSNKDDKKTKPSEKLAVPQEKKKPIEEKINLDNL